MKKRFSAAVLALVMTAACLTACGGENKTEDKQQTTTTTTEETTTTTETTTATTQNSGCGITTLNVTTTRSKMAPVSEVYTGEPVIPGQWHEDSETTTTKAKTTTTKVTTTKVTGDAPSEIPQDVNPGQWHEDSETTTTKAKTTTKPKTTTTKAKTTKAKVSTTNGYWHEDPGITKADLKAAAEAAFAKVKKTAIEYGWTVSKIFVNRSTDKQYGIYFSVDIAKAADGEPHGTDLTIKAETNGKTIVIQACSIEYGLDGTTDTNYDHFNYDGPLEDMLLYLKEYGVKKKQ